MANDPRTFLIKNCGQAIARGVESSTARKDFFGALGKAGDIELLNKSQVGGQVGEALRAFSKTSNLLRIGDIPPNDSAIPKNGTEVLAEAGINQAEAEQAGQFNPGVLNRAQGAAEAVADKVQAGNFEISDIPQAAADIQGLATLAGGIFSSGGQDSSRDLELCGASPYAMDLMAYAPKYKFLFVMEFEYTDAFANADNRTVSFVVKSSTRPHVNFEHEEVNMYNFWVKVPKRTSYEPMTVRMYDDQQNTAMGLYEMYLKAVSPIANLSFAQKMEDKDNALGAQSMAFQRAGTEELFVKDGSAFVSPYAASFGLIGGGTDVNVFKRITLYQIYNHGASVNMYKFFNPKVTSLELDDMDMAETGNGNEVSMQFAYDAVNITTGVSLGSNKTIASKIKTLSLIDKYSIDPLFKGDVDALTKTDPGKPPGDPDKGGGFFDSIGDSITDFTDDATAFGTGVVDSVTEVASNAFTSVSDFTGSIFSSGASSGDSNISTGTVEPDI